MKETPKYPGLAHQPVRGSGGGWFVQSVRRFLRAQFGNPTGFFGLIVGRIMARANVERIRWVVSLLGIHSRDRVLDVGCGPGVSLQMVSEIASEGFVAGIDHSAEMVRQAIRRNAAAVASGRVAVYEGSASNPPAFAERFDTIFTINSIHFWENPVECLKKLRDLLKPGGKIAVALQPQSRTATDETTTVIAQEISANLTLAGFSECRVETRKTSSAAALACILAKN